MSQLSSLEKRIIACDRCKRLRTYCMAVASQKKREFHDSDYWGKPVPGFGDPHARMWIVGLAPAAHGANRTGRVFTGDSSGRWLFRALYRSGFSNQEQSESRDDGLHLEGVYISAAVRCAPPANKPLPAEIINCSGFLDREFALLTQVRLFLALGNIGFRATCDLIARHRGPISRPRPRFGHNQLHEIGGFKVLCSYHPSRQNTQTGLLTEAMWFAIFQRAQALLE